MTAIGVGVVAAGSLIVAAVLLVARGGSGPACTPDPSGWNGAGGGPAQRGSAQLAVRDPGSRWSPVWTSPDSAGHLTAPPSAARGLVFNVRSDGTLVALAAGDGGLRWTSPPGGGESGAGMVAVALDGCSAVVATSRQQAATQLTGAVRAVDLDSHQRRWGVSSADFVLAAPEIEQGIVYAGIAQPRPGGGAFDRDYYLDGYAENDGSRGYRKRFQAGLIAPPTSDGEHVWIGDLDNSFYALGPGARQLWSFSTGGIISAGAVDGGSSLYVASADHNLYALEHDAPRERWHADAGSPIEVAPVLVDTTVVAAGRDGRVIAVDSQSGKVRWSVDIGAVVTHGLAAAGNRVAVIDDGGVMHLLDVASGLERGRWTAPAPPSGGPAVYGGRLLVTCADGRLYALPL